MSTTAQWCRVVITDCHGSAIASWTVGGAGNPDIGVVDSIARLHLEAKRRGHIVVLSQVCADLAALIRFAGLDDVLS